MTWGHQVRLLTPREQHGLGCGKHPTATTATHEATFFTAGRHGGAALVNRLRLCSAHAQDFAERNGLTLPTESEREVQAS